MRFGRPGVPLAELTAGTTHIEPPLGKDSHWPLAGRLDPFAGTTSLPTIAAVPASSAQTITPPPLAHPPFFAGTSPVPHRTPVGEACPAIVFFAPATGA